MSPLLTYISIFKHSFMPILHLVHWNTKIVIDVMKYQDRSWMHDVICLGEVNTTYICCNNTIMMWCGLWIEPHFVSLHWWFLAYVTHSSKHFLHGGGWFEGWLWSFFFFDIRGGIIRCHKPTHINNPWLLWTIFIDLFIIRFIIKNVQIGRVCKYGGKTSTIRSIPCPTILNDIYL